MYPAIPAISCCYQAPSNLRCYGSTRAATSASMRRGARANSLQTNVRSKPTRQWASLPLTRLANGFASRIAKRVVPNASWKRSTNMASSEDELFPLPQSINSCIDQTADAVKQALSVGRTRQQVSLLLPIEQRRKNYMFTESMEYPESSSEIYKTACLVGRALIEAVLNDKSVEVNAKRIDNDGLEGEPVGLLTTPNNQMTVIVLPTADVLREIRKIEKDNKGLIVLVNPQWRSKGQVVSDFGFGPWRKKAEDFVALFSKEYSLLEQRIGAASTLDPVTGGYMGLGGVARILKVAESKHQVFAVGGDGSSACIAACEDEPTYKELETLFAASKTSLLTSRSGDGLKSEEERLQEDASQVDSGEINWSLLSGAEVKAVFDAGNVNAADVAKMDKKALRASLQGFGLPSSGGEAVLRERVITAMKELKNVPEI